MYNEPPAKAPYLDWKLDRWKIGVVLALFVGLTIASIARPPVIESVKLPSEADLAAALGTGEAPSTNATPAEANPQSVEGDGNSSMLAPGAVRAADALRLPLTLASFGPNAVVPPETVRMLAGTAAAGSSIKVYDQVMARANSGDLSAGSAEEQILGLAVASDQGLWQLALAAPLTTGQHVITLRELGPQDALTGVSAPVVVTVLAAGEEGPMSLATPIIRSPALGVRMTPGVVEFTGTGLPAMVVRLYLNNDVVAESLVTANDDWRIVPEQPLSPGVYTARVTTVNPQGDVLAESAPLVFVVQEQARQSSLPLTLPAPTWPLTISGLAYGDRRRTTLLVNGLGTPHAMVAAWLGDEPVKAANVAADGHWLITLDTLILDALTVESDAPELEVRSSFGERVRTDSQLQQPVPVELPARPRLTSPRPGEILTNPRPLLLGVAQPMSDVAILVNRAVVAQVQADPAGAWSYHVVEPLPSGTVAIAAGVANEAMPDLLAAPIVVMVLPNHKLLALRSPLKLDQKPPLKLYYSAPTGP